MELSTLSIPKKFPEMQKAYELFYRSFSREIEQTSTDDFKKFIDNFVKLVVSLSKRPIIEDHARTAIGVLCLHNIGFPDFDLLSRIFDRIIPQVDLELVLFTSWAAGKLLHHPNAEQSRYVSHLFDRCTGWIRANGRRARHLAATHMIEALSANAGGDVVISYPQLQSAMWLLISHPSMLLIRSTAAAISMFARATMRYGRSDLDSILRFFTVLCIRLLSLGSPFKVYAALKIFEELIHCNPDYFLPRFHELFKTISEVTLNSQPLVKAATFSTFSYFALIDKQQFIYNIAPVLIEMLPEVLPEFPKDVSMAVQRIIEQCPDFFKAYIQLFKEQAELATYDQDSACRIFTALMKNYGEEGTPTKTEFVDNLMKVPVTEAIGEFYVKYAEYCSEDFGPRVCAYLEEQLADPDSQQALTALDILSKIPCRALANQEQLLCLISQRLSEKTEDYRIIVPRTIYHLTMSSSSLSNSVNKKLFQLAVFERNNDVRLSILDVISNKATKEIAAPEYMKYINIFANDGSTNVKKKAFELISKISSINPMSVASIIRETFLNTFYSIQNVPSIKTRAKIVGTLPSLIKSAGMTLNIYAPTIIDIASDNLTKPLDRSKLRNFFEVDSADEIIVYLCESLMLVAPIDPVSLSKKAEGIIYSLCDRLNVNENRKVILSSLKLLYVLLSPPASTPEIRGMVPIILAACSKFLSATKSRKARMQALKVIGAIGVLEVHQRMEIKKFDPPDFTDDSLSRQFFHPARDVPNEVDDTLLLHQATTEQSIIAIVSNALMMIFNDKDLSEFHTDAAQALAEVLNEPKMSVLSYFDKFISRLIEMIETAPDSDLEIYLPLFTRLVKSTHQNTSPFMKRALNAIEKRFNDQISMQCIELIIEFAKTMKDMFINSSANTICLLLQFLEAKKASSEEHSIAALNALSVICEYQNDLIFLIITHVSDVITFEKTIRTIRIAALKMFDKLVRSIDILNKVGPIVRALEYCLTLEDPETIGNAMNLLYSLLLAQGREFLVNADPLLDFLRIRGLDTPQLNQIIKAVSTGPEYGSFMSIKQPCAFFERKHQSPPPVHMFSEEAIIARVMTPAFGLGRHLEQWLHSFILTTINGSPCNCIRACANLASNYRPLAYSLFKIAFFTCWVKLSEEGKKHICDTFLSILVAPENYETVAHEILDLIFFMRKVDSTMCISSQDIVKSCLRYGYDAFALSLHQTDIYSGKRVGQTTVLQLIDVYVQLGEWQNANAVWKEFSSKMGALNRPETISKLRLWDKVMPIFKEKFKSGDTSAFTGLSKSLASMAEWSEMYDYIDTFNSMSLSSQRSAAPYFANAMMHLRKWPELDKALASAPDDSLRCSALSAISALHSKRYDEVDKIVNGAFSLLASRPIMLLTDNQQINSDTMLVAQQLVEILEMKNWVMNEKMRPAIESVWSERLTTAPKDFELWLKLLGNRAAITGVHDNEYIDFFQLRSITMDTKIHKNTFNALFPDFKFESSDPLAQICSVVTEWNTGNKKFAINQMKYLSKNLEGDLLDRCHILYASWLIETGETVEEFKDAFDHLREIPTIGESLMGDMKHSTRKISSSSALFLPKAVVNAMKENTTNVNILRMWSYVNIELISLDPPNLAHYVTNAIDALSQCCIMAPSFTDVVQLFNLFFDHANEGNVFEHTTTNCISRLQPKLLLQASPQILIQLSHPSFDVANFVHDTLFNLLHEHYHELIFSIIVMKSSKDQSRAKAANNLFDEFMKMNPVAHDEVYTIRKCLLRAGVTWYEKVMQKITDAFDFYALQQFDHMVDTLRSITHMVKNPKCALHEQFKASYSTNIAALERILRVFSPHNQGQMGQLTQWCKTMQALIQDDLKKIRIIQLSSISESLAAKTHFQLAVPGTYKPCKPIIRIRYFVGQFTVYMSKQQPKDVVIRGEDGNFYQYLVKGHEDLRLDERIMQFFRLINTYLKSETCFGSQVIQTTSVIPLSISNGLVQWFPGTDTLRSVVEQYRRLKVRDPIQEYNLTEKLSFISFDYMMPIQKMNIIKKVMSVVPDTDIANFIYLKARSAEIWHKQTVTFAISAAITSMVGYVIGLGDRHPSNLLIDRFTGRIIHIDFGDCFEKAAKRKFLPEVVPFRLTRMMVKAMGVTGASGTFKEAFINTSRILRENKRVLIMVLAIFVHEPLVDPREKRSGSANIHANGNGKNTQNGFVSVSEVTGSIIDKGRVLLNESNDKTTNTEMRARINQKLSGMEFNGSPLSVEEQAELLIQQATDTYNLSKMYSGWCPFW